MTALRQRLAQLIQRLGAVDRGVYLVLVIATLAAWPLFTRGSLPTMTDAEMHIYRTAVIESALQEGIPYLRWAPDFYYGYGYPVFNFYSPLSYHLAAYVSILTNTSAVVGTKFVLLLAFYIGGLGMYFFARDRWRSESGLIAATAWLFAPYIVYIDPFARGDVPQALSLAFGPLLFWAFDRLRRTGAWRYVALGGVTLAALIFSHPLMALLLYGLLLMFLSWELLIAPRVPRLQTDADTTPAESYVLLGVAISLGLMLAAMYWLPTGLERTAVKLENVAGGFFDFRNHFLTFTELLSLSPRLDWGATEPAFNFNLGVAQWVLALAGFLTVFINRLRRIDTLFFAFCAVIFIYLMTPGSTSVWETLPYMQFFQFPTRFLGPTALVLAPLAGASLRWMELLPGKLGRRVFTPLAIVVIMALALPLSYPLPWQEFGQIDRWRMLEVELQGRALGTTSADDFLPVAVDVVPDPQQYIVDQYRDGVWPIDKLNRATLPDDAEVTFDTGNAQYDRYNVRTESGFQFRMFRFDFPGWTARVDGEKVPIEVAKPEGFITFWVPPGEHTVELRMEGTLPRELGIVISVLGVLALLYAVRNAYHEYRAGQVRVEVVSLSEGATSFVALGLLLFFGVRMVADQTGWFYHQSQGDMVYAADVQYNAQLGETFELLAFDVPAARGVTTRQVDLTVYWRATGPIDRNYQVFAHLIDAQGQLWSQSDKLNPAGFPTLRWPLDRYVRDEHVLTLPDDLPPGRYQLYVGLWDASTGVRLPVSVDGGDFQDSVRLPLTIQLGEE